MLKPVLRSAAFAALLLVFGACATSPESPSSADLRKIPFVGSLSVYRTTLPNGLKILVVEDPSSPTFAYQTWFRVGSRNEQPQYTGLAHLFEHLMFKGTTTHKEGEFDRILESNGVEDENAFTSRDYTAYVQELPKDRLELIMQLESDRMVNLIVNDESFKAEREVVQNERRFRNENSPDGMMYQEIFGLAFTKHSYRWPVIGYAEDLSRMTAKDAEAFYRNFYSPSRATMVVIGDVKAEEVVRLAKKYYGGLKPTTPPEPAIPAEPAQTAARKKELKLNTQVQKLMLAYPVPEVTHEDIPALSLLRSILTDGKSSRLSKALVDTGIMTNVNAYDLDDRDPSIMILFGSMQKGKKAAQAEPVILAEIEKLKTERLSQAELEKAKNILSYQFYSGLSAADERARFLGHYETVSNGFEVGLDIFQKTQNLAPEDIQNVARKYFGKEKRSTLYGVQK